MFRLFPYADLPVSFAVNGWLTIEESRDLEKLTRDLDVKLSMYNTDEFLIELLLAVKCSSFEIKLPSGEIMAVAFPFFEDKIVVRYEEDTMDFNEDLFVKFNTRLYSKVSFYWQRS